MVFNPIKGIVSGKQPQNYGKSPFSMAKSTISMAIFNSELFVYQRAFIPIFFSAPTNPLLGTV